MMTRAKTHHTDACTRTQAHTHRRFALGRQAHPTQALASCIIETSSCINTTPINWGLNFSDSLRLMQF